MDEELWQWFLQIAPIQADQTERLLRACAWCWAEAFPTVPFPDLWSSSLCPRHYALAKQRHSPEPIERHHPEQDH